MLDQYAESYREAESISKFIADRVISWLMLKWCNLLFQEIMNSNNFGVKSASGTELNIKVGGLEQPHSTKASTRTSELNGLIIMKYFCLS